MELITVTLVSAMLLLVCGGVRGDAVDATVQAEEEEWDKKTLDVLNAIASSHAEEIAELEKALKDDDGATRTRIARNVAVSIYRLVMTHPLGNGKARVRKMFSQSELRRAFFWDDLFPPDDDLLPEDEDL
eukprot:TRINITY_DN35491_c0_g1_i1.p2 TRINITY_DN35491_c0_g1~~TRINITY_DN35491_c0_g1_i1.p2  ORF type:complete len:130 (+),score=32.11 TRINITY_DN35491_c0_g1_i1:76-465(+)